MFEAIYHVNAFTSVPFKGNPAAVCVLCEARPEGWMQSIAAEMNLAETAFLWKEADGYRLRWFTPKVEVPLCGHGTLAAAHVLWESGAVTPDLPIKFHTKSGLLTAHPRGKRIELDFPLAECRETPEPDGLCAALGLKPGEATNVARSEHKFLVEVSSEKTLRALDPDFVRLAKIGTGSCIVTCRGDAKHDFLSRFFAPSSGVNEDPVTGSAHCVLADYWRARLGKDRFRAHQASQRGGSLDVEVRGERVILTGDAITTLRGELQV